MWDSVVSALQACIFTLGHVTGSLGSGILLTAGALRLALLPLTMRLARRAQAHQRHLQALGPEIATLRSRHAKDPAGFQEALFALYRRHGVQPVDGWQVVGGLLQLPPISAMYAALRGGLGNGVRFGWVADLARPDWGLTFLVAALTAGATFLGASPTASRGALVASSALGAGLMVAFLLHASGAVGLSMAASSALSLGQAWWLRRSPAAA